MNNYVQYEYIPVIEKARLFCFHYAGGSASFYDGWNSFLPKELGVYPYQLAGHGARFGEPMADSLEEAASEAAAYIKELSDKPILLIGHSMGALIAYLTADILSSKWDIVPERLIISAAAPDFRELRTVTGIDMKKLDDEEYCNTLIRFGAIDKRVFRIKNFRELYLPVIRHDFMITDKFRADTEHKVKCGINVYGGSEDIVVDPQSLDEWKKYTDENVTVRLMSGGHFFIKEHKEEICREICSIISDII